MSRFSDRNRYDSVTDAENADDWLRMQLNKLKDRREKNPDTLRRKRQEKLLLEELKSASSSRQLNRDGTDRSATIDGSSQSNGGDPLTEYRLEEQRLQMTNSPYPETRERTDFSRPRRIIPAKSADIVLHKPPTPPPRAVSRSPPGSPYLRRSSLRTPTVEMTYQNERRNNMYRNDEFGQNDNGDYRMGWVTYQLQPQAAKSILKKRDTYNNSPSPMSNRRTTSSSSYQNDLSFSSLNRSATPAFPVRKETPLPYHPLLASNNSINNNGEDFSYSLTYRAASPRSLYYAQSGRSSVASVVT
uniref:CUPID domain-containing protein n=1 Tax=Syphacia muris TaxID=451379 RepID=A0A0N5AKG3_9BILA